MKPKGDDDNNMYVIWNEVQITKCLYLPFWVSVIVANLRWGLEFSWNYKWSSLTEISFPGKNGSFRGWPPGHHIPAKFFPGMLTSSLSLQCSLFSFYWYTQHILKISFWLLCITGSRCEDNNLDAAMVWLNFSMETVMWAGPTARWLFILTLPASSYQNIMHQTWNIKRPAVKYFFWQMSGKKRHLFTAFPQLFKKDDVVLSWESICVWVGGLSKNIKFSTPSDLMPHTD